MRGSSACALVVVLAIACGGSGIATAADVTADELLADMARSMHSLDYQGSFVYQHGGRTDALRVFHLGGARERERLISLTGPRSEVVRNGGTITCVQSGGQRTVFTNDANPSLVPLVPDANVAKLAANYTLRLGGEDRIAGYNSRVVDIAARDGYRYSYRLWLDQTSRMLLRSTVLDAHQRTLEQFMFVALVVGVKPNETDLLPGNAAGKARAPQDEVVLSGAPIWRVADLPAGYRLARSQRPVQGPPDAEHLMYSDGLASVSVYVEPDAGNSVRKASRISRGALNVYSHSSDGWRITVLGDVPAATVTRLARSVRRVSASDG
ncbi:MAG: MucB/RseB C-terminal domain-containing protein [Rhodanobacteraceae bacterium]